MADGKHAEASREMLDSRWAQQVGQRANRLESAVARGSLRMKSQSVIGAFGFIGEALSYSQTAKHYEAKALKSRTHTLKRYPRSADRSVHYKINQRGIYADYQDAINREPTVVTERVLVRANCPTNAAADSGGGVGEMQQQLSESNYTQKLLEALQQ